MNVRSVDKASRREPPLVTASRMGQTECVKLLLGCLPELDIERKDGQGRTALWHAVQEQRDDVVALLVEAGARLFYEGISDSSKIIEIKWYIKLLLNPNYPLINFQFTPFQVTMICLVHLH